MNKAFLFVCVLCSALTKHTVTAGGLDYTTKKAADHSDGKPKQGDTTLGPSNDWDGVPKTGNTTPGQPDDWDGKHQSGYTTSTASEGETSPYNGYDDYDGNATEYNQQTYDRVIKNVLENTDTGVRPKLNFSEPLELNIVFGLLSLASFDEISGEISLVASLKMTWSAETTPRWNPNYNLGGKESVTVSVTDVWKPQLFVLNPSKKVQDLTSNLDKLRISYDGSVEWNVVTIIEAACTIDVRFFPFDTQKCSIFIAPWGYDSSELQIGGLAATSHDYLSQDHNSWGLVDLKANGNNVEKTAYLNITVNFKRRFEFFLINVLLPPTLLSFLNPCVFLLPADSGERMSFSITCFLAFSVYMSLLGDNMPPSSSPVSHLSYFLMFMLVHSCGISLATILSLRMYHKDGMSSVPKWLQTFVKLVRFRFCRGDICRRKTHAEAPESCDSTEKNKIELDDINSKEFDPELTEPQNDTITWYTVGQTMDYFFFCLFLGWILFSFITTLMAISLL